jgi:hypothetical protein
MTFAFGASLSRVLSRQGQVSKLRLQLEDEVFGGGRVPDKLLALIQLQRNPIELHEERKWGQSMEFSFPPLSTS